MKDIKLPVTIDPFKSAQRRLECEGYFLLSEFQRLRSETQGLSERVDVKVGFEVDEQGLIVISGQGSTTVTLACQRCSEDFEQGLNIDFTFSPVKNEEAEAALPSYYDAINLDANGEINLRELVEDELLLAIPLIPRHKTDECQAPSDSTWGELPEELDKPNPFDVLKQLK